MKKFLTITLATFIFSVSLFSAPEISFSLIPLSFNFSFPQTKFSRNDLYYFPNNYETARIIYNSIKGGNWFNGAFLIRAGENFIFKNEKITGFSVLTDLGYSLQLYKILAGANLNTAGGKSVYDDYIKINTVFHTINLGLLIKLNMNLESYLPNSIYFKNMSGSFGIGGGVKMLVSATEINKIYTQESGKNYRQEIKNYSYTDLKDMFKYPFIPYIKIMYDFNSSINSLIGLNMGLQIVYNFELEYANMNAKTTYIEKSGGLRPAIPYPNTYFQKYSFSSLEIGISVGLTIAGFNYIKIKNQPAL